MSDPEPARVGLFFVDLDHGMLRLGRAADWRGDGHEETVDVKAGLAVHQIAVLVAVVGAPTSIVVIATVTSLHVEELFQKRKIWDRFKK